MLFEIKSHQFPPQDIRVLSCTFLSHYLYAAENTLAPPRFVCACFLFLCALNIQFCVSASLGFTLSATRQELYNNNFKETLVASSKKLFMFPAGQEKD